MKVREPVPRPLDIIAAELAVTISQAFLAGVLTYLAVGFWAERGVGSGPIVAILAAAGIAVSASWLYWLLGGQGWPMALSCLPISLYMGFALLLGLQGTLFIDLDLLLVLLTLAAAIYGVVAGFFLDSPRRWRWDQRRAPRPGTQVPRISAATERALDMLSRSAQARRLGRPGAKAGGRAPGPTLPSLTRPSPPTIPSGPSVRMATPLEPAARTGTARRPQASPLGPTSGGTADGDAGASRGAPPAESLGLRGSVSTRQPGIDLPTSDEPKARRSPWAWASPPEWNRDDLEEDPAPDGPRSPS